MHFELTWHIQLLGAVLMADLLVLLGLVAKELRELGADRRVAAGASGATPSVPDAAPTRVSPSSSASHNHPGFCQTELPFSLMREPRVASSALRTTPSDELNA
jgi:hypothetical protein